MQTLNSSNGDGGGNNPYDFVKVSLQLLQRVWERLKDTFRHKYHELYQVLMFSWPYRVTPPNPSTGETKPTVFVELPDKAADEYLDTHKNENQIVTNLLSEQLEQSVAVRYKYKGIEAIKPANAVTVAPTNSSTDAAAASEQPVEYDRFD